MTELKELKNSIPSEDGEIYIEKNNQFEFELMDDDGANSRESARPLNYYSFSNKKTKIWAIGHFFRWMRAYELSHRDSAGIRYALFAAILFGGVGITKCTEFKEITFINFFFLQIFTCLVFYYLFSRELEIEPFLDEFHQKKLNNAIFYLMIGGMGYITSWGYWPRQYSHFVLSVLPLAELIKEKFARRVEKNEYIFFVLNFVGMFILLGIPDTHKEFSLIGLGICLASVVALWVGFQNLRSTGGGANILSIGLIGSLVCSLFTPIFFKVQVGRPPRVIELLALLALGFFTFIGSIFFQRSIQITKPSHTILISSVALVLITLVQGYLSDGFVIWAVLGAVLSLFGVSLILWNESKKTEIVKNSAALPLI